MLSFFFFKRQHGFVWKDENAWVKAAPTVSTFDRHEAFWALSVSGTEEWRSGSLIGSTRLVIINLPQLHSASIKLLNRRTVIPLGVRKNGTSTESVCARSLKSLQQSLMGHLLDDEFSFPWTVTIGTLWKHCALILQLLQGLTKNVSIDLPIKVKRSCVKDKRFFCPKRKERSIDCTVIITSNNLDPRQQVSRRVLGHAF